MEYFTSGSADRKNKFCLHVPDCPISSHKQWAGERSLNISLEKYFDSLEFLLWLLPAGAALPAGQLPTSEPFGKAWNTLGTSQRENIFQFNYDLYYYGQRWY